jgi:hypothetical protein
MWQAKFLKLQGGGKEIISLTGETSAELCHDKGDVIVCMPNPFPLSFGPLTVSFHHCHLHSTPFWHQMTMFCGEHFLSLEPHNPNSCPLSFNPLLCLILPPPPLFNALLALNDGPFC